MARGKAKDVAATPDAVFAGVDQPVDPGVCGGAGVSGEQAETAGTAGAASVKSAGSVIDVDVIEDAANGTGEAGENPAGVPADVEEELDPLSRALAEADELRDRFIRLQAEWDNFRKRTAAERVQERIRAAEGLVERLLPIVDDLERAIEHSDTANETSLKEGIAAVHNKLTDVLRREGVKTIDPVGEAFDANMHQAVGKEDDLSVPDETVTKVYQKGYGMGDRVLRTAMVVVSQGGPKREDENNDQ
jgi:molecular chaperone GrpE